jgi:predicted nucleic-acid-binding protein
MIALDTNVLVRFLVEDDAAQTKRAVAIITRASRQDESLYIGDIVVVETVWVLTRAYKLPKAEVIDVMRRLVRARQLAFSSTDLVTDALDAYATGQGDFTDYLLRGAARAAGYEEVATFDRALHKEQGFVAP